MDSRWSEGEQCPKCKGSEFTDHAARPAAGPSAFQMDQSAPFDIRPPQWRCNSCGWQPDGGPITLDEISQQRLDDQDGSAKL